MLVDPTQHFLGWLLSVSVIIALLLGVGEYVRARFLKREVKEVGASELSPHAHNLEADEPFRAVAETASDGIISADENGDIIYWNPAAEKIFGYSMAQARGRSLTLLMPERLRKAHQEGMKRVVAQGESRLLGKVVELTGLKKDGREFPLELSLSTWTTSERRGFTGIVRDITLRKQLERRMTAEHAVTRFLAESPTLGEVAPKILQAICESLGWEMGAFWRVDQEGDVIRCSDVWHSPSVNVAKFTEFSKQTVFTRGLGLPGRVWASGEPSWITDVLQDANFPRAPIAAREGLHGALCFPIRRAGLVLGVMEFFSRKIQEPDDGLLQMLAAIGSQIGQFMERKRAEEQISSLKEYVQMILDSVPDPIVILNQDAQVQYINRASYKVFNLYPSDVKHRPLFDLLKVDVSTREELRSELGSYAKSRQQQPVLAADYGTDVPLRDPLAPQKNMSERHHRKEIKFGRRTYHYTCFPVEGHSDEGKLTGLVLRDTTEESSLQDQLIQAEKLAGIALLTSGLGHELNNPLYSVLGLSEAIIDEHDAAIMKEHAKVIVEEARRMGRIIKDLTGRSAIEASDLRVEVDVNEQLNYALGLTLPVPPDKNLQVEKRLAATRKIWANPFEVRQVFVNIISNAIQAMKGNGTLELASDINDGDGMVRIIIRDSGPGIAAPHVSKIFDPFFTTKKQGEGTGLGLTIAHRIVTKHAGQIQVDTHEPEGTTFTITFPLMDTTT